MKKAFALLALCALFGLAFAYVTPNDIVYRIPASESDFPIEFVEAAHIASEAAPANLEVPLLRQYNVNGARGAYTERLTVLNEIKTYPNLDDEDLARKLAYEPLLERYVKALTGREALFAELTRLNDDDVRQKFNADFGFTIFVAKPVSRYCENFQYVMLEFFFKKGVGMVVRSLLSNNVMDFLVFDEPFLAAYNSFRFSE